MSRDAESPLVATSTSTDISNFKNRGGKIIWYHDISDPGPPGHHCVFRCEGEEWRGGNKEIRPPLPRPNMGHCRGGPATDQFDLLTPLVN
jgi:feruloyl esterase